MLISSSVGKDNFLESNTLMLSHIMTMGARGCSMGLSFFIIFLTLNFSVLRQQYLA